MRIAILSDIHGNRHAFEAVLADLRETAPDLILHGGDLAGPGASPVEIVDWIRDLGWLGVVGNTDEMLFRPASLQSFAQGLPDLRPMFDATEEMAEHMRTALGKERLFWLQGLPRVQMHDSLALVHAGPNSLWRAPAANASDSEMQSVYGTLGRPIAIYGHIHLPFVRRMPGLTVANSGSVGLPFDGDRRAAYLLSDEGEPAIRRVEYDVERELKSLAACGLPHNDWLARMLASGSPQPL